MTEQIETTAVPQRGLLREVDIAEFPRTAGYKIAMRLIEMSDKGNPIWRIDLRKMFWRPKEADWRRSSGISLKREEVEPVIEALRTAATALDAYTSEEHD